MAGGGSTRELMHRPKYLAYVLGQTVSPYVRSFPTEEYTIVETYFEINWDIIRRYSRHLFFERALSPILALLIHSI